MTRPSPVRPPRKRNGATSDPMIKIVHRAGAPSSGDRRSASEERSYLARAPIMDHAAAKDFILAKLDRELPGDRTYHSRGHTWDVYLTAIDIAEKEGVNGDDLLLLKTAALYHDAGFTEQDLDHEDASCRIARQELPAFGYTRPQIEYICRMIEATRIPQSPRDKLSRILCDADLDYLGRPDFFRIASKLFAELKAYKVVDTERQWNELQLRFLERHKFFTGTNKRDREPQKKVHLAKVRKWLEESP